MSFSVQDGFMLGGIDDPLGARWDEMKRALRSGDPLACAPPPRHRGHPRFYELLKEMERIHDAKNSDYADSASDPLRNFRACEDAGISAFDGCITRLSDKYMRVMNLAKKEREGRKVGVLSEAIEDTLLDLSCYALIAIILYEEGQS